MRLIKLRLKDFRRFAGDQALDLNEDLIALVGPNEAGKSSILRALDLMGRLEAPGFADITRGLAGPAVISALFALDADDRALLADIHDGAKVAHLWVDLTAGHERSTWRPEPQPLRELAPRERCKAVIERLAGDPALDAVYPTSDEWPWDPQQLTEVTATVGSQQETLTDEAISSFELPLKAWRVRVRRNTVQLGLHQCSFGVGLVLGGGSRSRIVGCRTWCRWVC